jgi:hypothetical protein
MPRLATKVDFAVANHFTLWRFLPLTARAKKWADDHIPEKAFWGHAFLVEHRYVEPILQGIAEAGLTYG